MELSSTRGASYSIHPVKHSYKLRDREQRKVKDDCVNTTSLVSTTLQAFNASSKLGNPPGCDSDSRMPLKSEYYIQSTPESSETSTLSSSTSNSRLSLNRRLTTLYKPLKRYFNPVDPRGSRESVLVEHRVYKRNRPKSASFSSPTCNFQGANNSSRPVNLLSSSFQYFETKSPSGSLQAANAASFETIKHLPRSFEPGSPSDDHTYSPTPFPSSATIAEGIHYPKGTVTPTILMTPVVSGSHSRSRTFDDRSPATYTRQSSAHSRFSSIASSGSNRSSRLSFTRQTSGFLSKSTEILLVDQRLCQSEDWSRRGESVPDSPSKAEGFGENGCPETKDARFSGKKSWSKFLSGYTSPIRGSPSSSFFNRRGTKTPFTTPSPPCTPQEDLSFSNQTAILPHEESTKNEVELPVDISLDSTGKASRERSCSCPPSTSEASIKTRSEPRSVCKAKGTAISPFIVGTLLQMLLFCVCPPRYLIAIGGVGMLFVFIILMVGLACVSWTIFDSGNDGDQERLSGLSR